jgi:hypothetical protein
MAIEMPPAVSEMEPSMRPEMVDRPAQRKAVRKLNLHFLASSSLPRAYLIMNWHVPCISTLAKPRKLPPVE